MMSLALSRWVEDGTAILITGPTGSGKSWLACALAQYACRRGQSALYLRVPRLAEDSPPLRGAPNVPARRWGGMDGHPPLWSRHLQHAPTIITSQLRWSTGMLDRRRDIAMHSPPPTPALPPTPHHERSTPPARPPTPPQIGHVPEIIGHVAEMD